MRPLRCFYKINRNWHVDIKNKYLILHINKTEDYSGKLSKLNKFKIYRNTIFMIKIIFSTCLCLTDQDIKNILEEQIYKYILCAMKNG